MSKIKLSELKEVGIDTIDDHEKNPNKHPVHQVEALAKSIERYGQYYPVIIDENNTILTGHGKRMALRHLGRKKVEVRVVSGMTQKQKLKLLLEDNKIQDMSTATYGGIEDLIKDIGEGDILGFNDDYINMLLQEDDLTIPDSTGTELEDDPADVKVKQKFTLEDAEKQADLLDSFESEVQKSKTMACPNCGHKINL